MSVSSLLSSSETVSVFDCNVSPSPFFILFPACPDGTFGDVCKQTCDCHGQHVQSCDHVDGTCHCKAGWEGSSCDDDIDECASDNLNNCSDTTHTVCQNTDGGFTCVCQDGFRKDGKGVCIGKFYRTLFRNSLFFLTNKYEGFFFCVFVCV